jgi:uncharacterized protein (TIGR02186 family)
MIRNKTWIPVVIIVVVSFIWHPQLADSKVSVTAKNEPNLIAIGALFNGTQLTVSGDVGIKNDVVVIVSGKQESLALKKKGKALGLLWMNLGDVHIQNVPNVYLLYSSEPNMASAEQHPNIWEKLGFGFEYLKNKMEIEAPQAERDLMANEFFKLKQKQGLYAFHPGEIRFEQKNESEKSFTAAVWIPPRIPFGEYQINVMEMNDGQVIDTAKHALKVKEEGIPLMLSSLAFNHSLLYGFFAVLIAVAAGLVMDFFFGTGKGGGAH